MRVLDLDEVRSIQLHILREVTNFCDEHDITYSLCGGTLLGAVRHQGYIPWDDDIDIMLPRPEYERLMETFESDGLTLYNISTKGYDKPYAKIGDNHTHEVGSMVHGYEKGVNIDAFPIDGFPDSLILTFLHINKMTLWKQMYAIKGIKLDGSRPLIRKSILLIIKSVLRFIPKKLILKRITKMAQKYSFESSRQAGISVWGYKEREVCPRLVFDKQTELLFEGDYFKAWKDYDTYLSNVYGDYMKLPPAEERKSHDFKYVVA
jgi:lipopolysaccharide cholinephosphotransferase